MNWINHVKKSILSVLALGAIALPTLAQDAPAATTQQSDVNLLAYLLVITTVVLAIIIWGLGQVLVALSRQALDKAKQAGTTAAVILTGIFLLAGGGAYAQDAAAAAAEVTVLPNYGGLTANEFYLLVSVIFIEVLTIIYLGFGIRRVYNELLPQQAAAAAKESQWATWWAAMDKKFFTKAVPVEKEADVLLDHDYDGIRELDNSLPPWWKYGFYVTIGVAFVYIINFHVMGSGKNPTQEYLAEMDKARIEKEIYDANNKDKIDEKAVPLADANGIARGKEIFNADCWACHGKLGEGGAGPNLTDNYWIHKGSLNDIYMSIKTGYPDKGMQSWAVKYTPKQMSEIASYITTLKGTNPPNGKAPQGDLFEDAAAGSTATPAAPSQTDSTATTKN